MYYERLQTEHELLGELVEYNVGNINEISQKAEEVLELVTRPVKEGENFSYILGKQVLDRVRLRGENEIQITEVTEDYLEPDGIYRIPEPEPCD